MDARSPLHLLGIRTSIFLGMHRVASCRTYWRALVRQPLISHIISNFIPQSQSMKHHITLICGFCQHLFSIAQCLEPCIVDIHHTSYIMDTLFHKKEFVSITKTKTPEFFGSWGLDVQLHDTLHLYPICPQSLRVFTALGYEPKRLISSKHTCDKWDMCSICVPLFVMIYLYKLAKNFQSFSKSFESFSRLRLRLLSSYSRSAINIIRL